MSRRFNINDFSNNNEYRNIQKDYSIPYVKLLDPSKEDARVKRADFLKDNGVHFYVGMYPIDLDYEIFVGCMDIFENTGVDYFRDYKQIRLHNQYRTVSGGVRNYIGSFDYYVADIMDISYLNNYKKEVLETIEIMNFFNIGSYNDTSIEQYIEYYKSAETEWNEFKTEELEKRKLKNEISSNNMRNSYYNFEEFDNNKFNRIFKECIQDMDMGKNMYILDEVININVNLEDNKTFIVFLRKNDKVCFVGRTKNLLNYIGTKSKEHGADRVAFYPVDNDYIDDIYIKALIEFDVTTGGTVRNTNRKYISMTSVKRIFKELYKINLVHIKKIISKYDIERFLIGDIMILDKIELDRATKDYLNLEQ